VSEPLEADVAIIGGGIQGTSAALHLAQWGRSVVLLERGFVGAQASGVNFGNVRQQGRALAELPLARRSAEIWGRLEELVGDACEFVASGNLYCAYEEADAAGLEAFARDAADYGLEVQLIGANQLRERWPWLGKDVILGSFAAADGHANPRLVAPAFARAAHAAGVVVLEHTEVSDVAQVGQQFEIETVTGGRIRAAQLLNTAGAWGHVIAERFGEPVPLEAYSPQLAVTEPAPAFIEPTVAVVGGVYLRQVTGGGIVFGGGPRGPALRDEGRAYVLPEHTIAQMSGVRRLVPALAELAILRVWGGIEGLLPDEIPVIGPSRTTPGLYHAFGFSGHGFQLGPAVGAVLAELIVDGRTETPIEAFDIARFQKRQNSPKSAS
jgi:sarcosine oxidase subunit beta